MEEKQGTKTYRFQIQSCIDVEIHGEPGSTVEDARKTLIDSLSNYADQMVSSSCYVSEGVEVK